jgi:hypothetical protein
MAALGQVGMTGGGGQGAVSPERGGEEARCHRRHSGGGARYPRPGRANDLSGSARAAGIGPITIRPAAGQNPDYTRYALCAGDVLPRGILPQRRLRRKDRWNKWRNAMNGTSPRLAPPKPPGSGRAPFLTRPWLSLSGLLAVFRPALLLRREMRLRAAALRTRLTPAGFGLAAAARKAVLPFSMA